MEGWSQEIRVRFVWQRGVRFLKTLMTLADSHTMHAQTAYIHAKYAKYPTSLYLDRLNSIYIDSVTYYCCQLPFLDDLRAMNL